MRKMSKEEFLDILSRQQRSGLTIKDFCVNEAKPIPNLAFIIVKENMVSLDLIVRKAPLPKNSLLSI